MKHNKVGKGAESISITQCHVGLKQRHSKPTFIKTTTSLKIQAKPRENKQILMLGAPSMSFSKLTRKGT